MKAVDVLHRSIVAALGLTTAVVGVSFVVNVASAMNWHMEHQKQQEASDSDLWQPTLNDQERIRFHHLPLYSA